MNLFNRGDRDPDEKRSVTRRQLLIRAVFYLGVFAALIWWANA